MVAFMRLAQIFIVVIFLYGCADEWVKKDSFHAEFARIERERSNAFSFCKDRAFDLNSKWIIDREKFKKDLGDCMDSRGFELFDSGRN